MPKPRSAWRDYAVYLALRTVVCLVQAMPAPLAWRMSELLAWLVHVLDRRHRQVAADNLRHAFPHLSDAQIAQVVRKVYRHFGLMIIEMMLMPRKYHSPIMDRYVHYPTPSDQLQCIAWHRGTRPLIPVTGHFGNWEMLSYMLGLTGFKGAVVARRLDNPFVDRFLKRFRLKTGQIVLDKKKDYDLIRQTLAEGKHLGMVVDQDAGPRGLFVDFFGRPASTHKAIAILSLEYSAPIVVCGVARGKEPLHYDFYLADMIRPEEYADKPDAARLITERYTQALEKIIRVDPTQYFWLHRRWKNQPPVRKATVKKAA
jgi:KDO2-lipid IV(A) lauroyltransferase